MRHFLQPEKTLPVSFTSSDSSGPSTSESSSDSDSEYEIEEIYQLKEWFPPDHRKAGDGNITVTDVTVNNHTVSNTHQILEMIIKTVSGDLG